jgi:hypothetical protein
MLIDIKRNVAFRDLSAQRGHYTSIAIDNIIYDLKVSRLSEAGLGRLRWAEGGKKVIEE